MGVLNNNKVPAIRDLKEYFEKYFSEFEGTFRTEFVKWSGEAPVIKEICENMDLQMILRFSLDDSKKIEFFIGKNVCKEREYDINSQNYIENEQNVQIIEEKSDKVKNTGLSLISDYFSDPAEVIWRVSFEENWKEHLYKRRITAKMFLTILKDNIDNLNKIQRNSEEEIKEYFSDKIFIDDYITEIKKGFIKIPDNEFITRISLLNYEKRKSCGTIYFLNESSLAKEKERMICFDNPNCLQILLNEKHESSARIENIGNEKNIRKLLEICRDSENCLVASANDGKIIGILPEKIDLMEGDFSIGFDGSKWELCLSKETLLRYNNGMYYIDSKNEKEEMRRKCREAGISFNTFGKLFELVEHKASHGALIIVADDAEAEVNRLCGRFNRGMKIHCCNLCGKIDRDNDKIHQMILGMTNADGAVFFDYEGNCYGFNIILDGIASVPGDIGRGSRYNSAVNYISYENIRITHSTKEIRKRCAIIRSEDKEKGFKIISNDQL